MYDCCIKKDQRKTNKQTKKTKEKCNNNNSNKKFCLAHISDVSCLCSLTNHVCYLFATLLVLYSKESSHKITALLWFQSTRGISCPICRCSPMFCFFVFFFWTTGVTTATKLLTFHKPKQSHESQRIPVQTLASPQSEISITMVFENGGVCLICLLQNFSTSLPIQWVSASLIGLVGLLSVGQDWKITDKQIF